VNKVVRLTCNVPTLWLSRGDVGVVQSVWMSPANWFEVEFSKSGQPAVRALLAAHFFELVEVAPLIAGQKAEAAKHD
jgi:hypothetical protein